MSDTMHEHMASDSVPVAAAATAALVPSTAAASSPAAQPPQSDPAAAAQPMDTATAALAGEDEDDEDDDLSSDDGTAVRSNVTARLATVAAQLQQGQAHLAHLSDEAATAAAAAALSHPADPDEDGADLAAVVPLSVRMSALRTSELRSHLLLFPSHKNDATYQDTSVPAADRKTTYETAGPFDHYGCPVVMNTPDALVNVQPEEDEEAEHVAALLASAAQQRASNLERSPLDADEAADMEQEVLGSVPPFLLSSPAAALREAADEQADPADGALRSNFVQCHKCRKWRTLPEDVSTSDLPSTWTCDQNTWEVRFARCAAPDELFEDGELWPFMPKRFVRYTEHDTFYHQLVDLLQQQQQSSAEMGDGEQASLEKFPYIRRRPVDLFLMYRSVLALGGYDKVCASNQWRTIQSCLRIPDQHDSSLTLKRLYRQMLLEYERRHWKPLRSGGHATTPPATTAAAAVAAGKGATRPPKPVATGAAAGGAADSSSRKRRQKDVVGAAASAGSGFALDESERKRARRNVVTPDDDEKSAAAAAGADEDMLSEGEERLVDAQGRPLPLSLPRTPSGSNPYAHLSASVPLPSINAVSIGVRNLRASMESKLRTLEDRVERRLARMETTLAKAIHDSTVQMMAAAHAQQKTLQRMQREQQRRDELMARGLNMLIAERLQAALPKDLHKQIKDNLQEANERAAERAAAASFAVDSAAAAPAAAAASSARVASPPPAAAALPARPAASFSTPSAAAASSPARPSASRAPSRSEPSAPAGTANGTVRTEPMGSSSGPVQLASKQAAPSSDATVAAGAVSTSLTASSGVTAKSGVSSASSVDKSAAASDSPTPVAAAPASSSSGSFSSSSSAEVPAVATLPSKGSSRRPRVRTTHYALITSMPASAVAADTPASDKGGTVKREDSPASAGQAGSKAMSDAE